MITFSTTIEGETCKKCALQKVANAKLEDSSLFAIGTKNYLKNDQSQRRQKIVYLLGKILMALTERYWYR